MKTAGAGLHLYWFWGCLEEKELAATKGYKDLGEEGKRRMKKKQLCPQPPEVLLSLAQVAKRPALLLLPAEPLTPAQFLAQPPGMLFSTQNPGQGSNDKTHFFLCFC